MVCRNLCVAKGNYQHVHVYFLSQTGLKLQITKEKAWALLEDLLLIVMVQLDEWASSGLQQ